MLDPIVACAVPLMALGFAIVLAGYSLVASFRSEPVRVVRDAPEAPEYGAPIKGVRWQ
jgi:hypothetical protein